MRPGYTVVYRFAMYDIARDEMVMSRRMATREAIAMVGGIILEDTGCLAAPGDLDQDIPGMTDRDFLPPKPAPATP
jgi:hypothetical protein